MMFGDPFPTPTFPASRPPRAPLQPIQPQQQQQTTTPWLLQPQQQQLHLAWPQQQDRDPPAEPPRELDPPRPSLRVIGGMFLVARPPPGMAATRLASQLAAAPHSSAEAVFAMMHYARYSSDEVLPHMVEVVPATISSAADAWKYVADRHGFGGDHVPFLMVAGSTDLVRADAHFRFEFT